MSHAATAVVQLTHYAPPKEGHILPEVTGRTTLVIHFPGLPAIGQRVTWGKHTWVVVDVAWELGAGMAESELTARARVTLDEASIHGIASSPSAAAVMVRLFYEEEIGTENYEGSVIPMPSLPRVGDEVYEMRGDTAVRYSVVTVGFHLCNADDRYYSQPEVVIRREQDPEDRKPWWPRWPHFRSPSTN